LQKGKEWRGVGEKGNGKFDKGNPEVKSGTKKNPQKRTCGVW